MAMVTRHQFIRPLRVAALLATVALGAASAPVSATMYEHGSYEDTDSFSYDDCGFHVDVASSSGGRYSTRTGTGKDAGAFYSHNAFWWREVHVPSNGGRTLIISARQVFQETQGVRVSGNVFEFHARVPGTITVTDGSGNLVLRDAGVIKQVYRIDTLGDATPGGINFEMLSYTWSGPHPGETTDICTLF